MGNCVCVKTHNNEIIDPGHPLTGIASRIRRDSFGDVCHTEREYSENSNTEQSTIANNMVEVEIEGDINDMELVNSETDRNDRNWNQEETTVTHNTTVLEIDIQQNDQADEMEITSDVESESVSNEEDVDDNLNISFEEEINYNRDVYIDGDTCSVCAYKYDNGDHTPQILPCGHTLCVFCIQKISRRHKYRHMICPLDRKRHHIKAWNIADDTWSLEAHAEALSNDRSQAYEQHVTVTEEEASTTPRTYHPRLCIMRKRLGSQSYGFEIVSNEFLHFICRVDANSPAEDAGLQIGDRVIEVNGDTIQNCTQQQVAEKIRKYSVVTWMLVVDYETDYHFREEGINVTADMSEVITIEAKPRESAGIFTVPSTGVYLFSWSVTARKLHTEKFYDIWVKLVVNGDHKLGAVAESRNDSEDNQGSNIVILKVNQGDNVSVVHYGGTDIYGDDYERTSSFSGVLLYFV